MKGLLLLALVCGGAAYAATVRVVATVNGYPITDADITERTKLLPPALNNRENAKNAIIDDYIKIDYARQFKIEPTEKEVDEAIKNSKREGGGPQLRLAARAAVAWQMMIMRAIAPTISVGKKEFADELADIERAQGLPEEITFVRLINIPAKVYEKLEAPKDCDGAEKMARDLGGAPQRITALGYELAPEIRAVLAGLEMMRWSPLVEKKAYLICGKKKTSEWKDLDDIVRQNAIYKRALFRADQILKQQRRKAIIVTSD